MPRPNDLASGTDPANGLNQRAQGRVSITARCAKLREIPLGQSVQSNLPDLCVASHSGADAKSIADDVVGSLYSGGTVQPAQAYSLARRLDDTFPPAVMVKVLEQLDEHVQQDLHMQRLYSFSRHPHLGTSPGLVLPYTASVPSALIEGIRIILEASEAYLRGLVTGLNQQLGAGDLERLRVKLRNSTLINAVFPVVFLSGAVVGIIKDVIGAVKGIVELVNNISAIAEAVKQLVSQIIKNPEIAFEFGLLTGKELAKEIQRISQYNLVRFTFELGAIVGPTIVYIVLTIMGIPQAIGVRLVSGFVNVVRRFPSLKGLTKQLGKLMSPKGRPNLDHEIDDAFARLARGEIPGQGDMLGDLMFHQDRVRAMRQLRQLQQAGKTKEGVVLRGRPGRTPDGADINPNPGLQSAHSTPQSALRVLHAYNPNEMITRFLPTGKGHAHTLFDKAWERGFKQIHETTGRTTVTAQEVFDVVSKAAKESGAFSPTEARSMVGLIHDDLFRTLGLTETDVLRMPGM